MKDNQSYSALDLASNLISKYKNLKSMLDLSITELSEIKGIGMVKAVQILAAFDLKHSSPGETIFQWESEECSSPSINFKFRKKIKVI
jgi:DNA repair protein RadC